ncbi:hypothetical protein Hanom_Chr08g00753921 [Helianthus anomalus]
MFDTRLSSSNYVVLFGYGVFSVCLYQDCLYFNLTKQQSKDLLKIPNNSHSLTNL